MPLKKCTATVTRLERYMVFKVNVNAREIMFFSRKLNVSVLAVGKTISLQNSTLSVLNNVYTISNFTSSCVTVTKRVEYIPRNYTLENHSIFAVLILNYRLYVRAKDYGEHTEALQVATELATEARIKLSAPEANPSV